MWSRILPNEVIKNRNRHKISEGGDGVVDSLDFNMHRLALKTMKDASVYLKYLEKLNHPNILKPKYANL